jgi:hypothetical protein
VIGPVSRQARAVLHHPDQRSHWIVVMAADVPSPLSDLEARLAAVHDAAPIVGARLCGDRWERGAPCAPAQCDGDPLTDERLTRRFDLGAEAPLRVVVGHGGMRLAVAGHHAAFDGQDLLVLTDALTGGPLPAAAPTPPADAPMPAGAPAGIARRLLRPADRVAPSPDAAGETMVARDVVVVGPDVTARLAAAAVAAAARHNQTRGAPWRRVAVSLGVGGPPAFGNRATYRRVDVSPSVDVVAAVAGALRDRAEPPELLRAPRFGRLLGPVAARLSDSLLVSNLGRHDVGAVTRLEFYPVARGRSAVAVGAVGLTGGPTTLTLRARDLTIDDARALLDDVVSGLGGS